MDLPTVKEFPALWARVREILIPVHAGLSQLGVKPAQGPPQALAAPRAKRSPGKTLQAYQRGLTALTQRVKRGGRRLRQVSDRLRRWRGLLVRYNDIA
ncbi:hypothetical protein ACWG5P_27910 [Streptomyces prasinus]